MKIDLCPDEKDIIVAILARERQTYRDKKNYVVSDAIRDILEKFGVGIVDLENESLPYIKSIGKDN